MKPLFAVLAVAAAVAGCSGGGGTVTNSGSGGGSGSGSGGCTTNCSAPVLAVSLSSNTVSTATPATVSALVKDANGKPVAGIVVNFAVNATVGALSSASALTNSSGVATVTLSPASGALSNAADTLTATVNLGATPLTQTAGYQLSTTSAQFVSFTADDLSGGSLPAYNQTTLTLKMSGVSTSAPVTVTVASDCVSAGKAVISPASTVSTTGNITFTYQDTKGCGATLSTDNITVTAAGATPPTKTLQIPMAMPAATGLTFTGASANPIFLQGSGGTTSSVVTFTVVDIAGNPLPNQAVTMNLSTFAGGVLIDGGAVPVTKTSNSNGQVQTIVSAGTVPTPVRVSAVLGTDSSGSISTVSSALAVGTGLPTELGFSFTGELINMEGYNWDNSYNGYVLSATDRSANPVPTNTAISIVAESGQIPSSVLTPDISHGGLSSMTVLYATQLSSMPRDGRVTILAYALGEESFQDLNGNNVWDPGEPFQDLGDPFKDELYDGVFDAASGDEWFSVNGQTHGGSAACATPTIDKFKLNSTIPSMANTCDGTWSSKVYVRRAVETVMSTSAANPVWYVANDTLAADAFGVRTMLPGSCSNMVRQVGATADTAVGMFAVADNPTLYIGSGAAKKGTAYVILSDNNPVRLNPMPAGATVSVNGDSSYGPVPNQSEANVIPISYDFNSGTETGARKIVVTTLGPLESDLKTHIPNSGLATTISLQILLADPPSTCTPS
jgi:hypothetical protein